MSASLRAASCKFANSSRAELVTFRGIHHAGLVVDDLDAAIMFYGALLSMELVERDHWRAPAPAEDQAVGLAGSGADGVMLRGSNSYLEVWTYESPAQVGDDPAERGAHERGLRHLAIEVDDVDGALARLVELGGTRMGDPVDLGNGAAVVYCRDPFGTLIEFMAVGSEMASLDDLE